MRVTTIPEKLEKWDIKIINKLITYPDIESETFDFKSEPSDLSKHICAMANTSGGFIVLGVEELKNNLQKTTKFEKRGFKNGTQDDIGLEIGNSTSLIEPTPIVDLNHIEDSGVFYTVIKIANEIFKKPFFLRDKGQCFIRIGNSSRPAPRTTIMNFFSSSIEQRKNLENLRSSAIILKEELFKTLDYMKSINPDDPTRPPPVDLTLIRNAVMNTLSFLSETGLLGKHDPNTSVEGMTTVFHIIEQLNVQLDAYSRLIHQAKADIRRMIIGDGFVLADELRRVPKILDKVIEKTDEFLAKYQ